MINHEISIYLSDLFHLTAVCLKWCSVWLYREKAKKGHTSEKEHGLCAQTER